MWACQDADPVQCRSLTASPALLTRALSVASLASKGTTSPPHIPATVVQTSPTAWTARTGLTAKRASTPPSPTLQPTTAACHAEKSIPNVLDAIAMGAFLALKDLISLKKTRPVNAY
jgi:hypothetical protein